MAFKIPANINLQSLAQKGQGILSNLKLGNKSNPGQEYYMKDYVGRLIRIAKDRVYLVTEDSNNGLQYIDKLPLPPPDGRSWESVIDIPTVPLVTNVAVPAMSTIFGNPTRTGTVVDIPADVPIGNLPFTGDSLSLSSPILWVVIAILVGGIIYAIAKK